MINILNYVLEFRITLMGGENSNFQPCFNIIFLIKRLSAQAIELSKCSNIFPFFVN